MTGDVLHRRPAAVIFDMDGLMLDTEPLAARAWTDAAVTLGVAFDHAVTPRLVGRNFPDCVALIRAHHGDDYPVDALMGAWHAAYDAIVAREGIELKAGLVDLLAWLDAAAIPKAVATSTRRSRATVKLEHTALAHRFAALVGGDEIARGKPAPDIFLAAAQRLGIAAAECLVLEDSEPGIHGALAAGMQAILVPDGIAPPRELVELGLPVMTSLVEVRLHIEGLPA
jgi:HAD superfamily hydrolase (TIGR01509 family)